MSQVPITPLRTGIQHRNGTPAAGGMPRVLALLLRLILGGILLYAGYVKAVGPGAEFAAAVEAYKILPASLVSPFALILPYFEMGLGMYLFFGFLTPWSAAAAGALFIVFLGALGSAMLRGIDLASCGCFGADSLSPRTSLFLDTALLLLSALLYALSRKHPPLYSLDSWLKE